MKKEKPLTSLQREELRKKALDCRRFIGAKRVNCLLCAFKEICKKEKEV